MVTIGPTMASNSPVLVPIEPYQVYPIQEYTFSDLVWSGATSVAYYAAWAFTFALVFYILFLIADVVGPAIFRTGPWRRMRAVWEKNLKLFTGADERDSERKADSDLMDLTASVTKAIERK